MNIIVLGNSKSVVSFINGLKIRNGQKISIITHKKS